MECLLAREFREAKRGRARGIARPFSFAGSRQAWCGPGEVGFGDDGSNEEGFLTSRTPFGMTCLWVV